MIMEELKVVVGSGGYNNNPGWIHTEENELNLLDETTWAKLFKECSISAMLAEHVWEHLTYEEGVVAAKIAYNYLKKEGYIRCAVPDAFFQDEVYQSIVKVGGPGPKNHPAADHKIVYNYRLLTAMFEEAGYEVRLIEYCDEKGRFHDNEWDIRDGLIYRSKKCDPRNQGESLVFPSLIVDAVKVG